MQGELWLVRTTKKGVWGAQERACAFFRRPTAVRWVERLAATNPGITLDVIEFDERTLSVPLDAPKPDEASRAGSADVAEEEATESAAHEAQPESGTAARPTVATAASLELRTEWAVSWSPVESKVLDSWLKPVGTLENADELVRSKRLFGELVSLHAAARIAPPARQRILTRFIGAILFGV